MAKRLIVRRNRYFDSVFLMQVAHQLAGQPGIRDASAVMGTEANRKVLAELGYGAGALAAELSAAAPNDLVFALEGDEAAVQAVAADPDRWLSRSPQGAAPAGSAEEREPRSLEESLAMRPDATVAVISVPGQYAAREARAAITRGLSVFLFSSNVSVEDELALKRQAREKGLVVMGPDCGTAYLGGAGIGFANAVRRGPIGIVGSTGTGMQELASLVHQAGSGISHGIGTGSRDLSDAIGGISTMTAIDALDRDPGTKVVVLLSKPSGVETTERVMRRLAACGKPAVVCVLGARGAPAPAPGGRARYASTIDEAAVEALEAVGVKPPKSLLGNTVSMRAIAAAEVARMSPAQRYVRGVFAGGTFCYQTQAILSEAGLHLYSNSPLPGMRELDDPRVSHEHSMVDMGAEIFVEGRPHPMIDATLRKGRVAAEGRDPAVALLLLDFILGAISSSNPVGDLIDAISEAKAGAQARGGHLSVVASVCGTSDDAQGLEDQSRVLRDAGVLVFPSNAQAALFSREVALLLAGRKEKG
ncbi:MAG: FdrA family protein [Spirochaetia bacterium]